MVIIFLFQHTVSCFISFVKWFLIQRWSHYWIATKRLSVTLWSHCVTYQRKKSKVSESIWLICFRKTVYLSGETLKASCPQPAWWLFFFFFWFIQRRWKAALYPTAGVNWSRAAVTRSLGVSGCLFKRCSEAITEKQTGVCEEHCKAPTYLEVKVGLA